MLTYQRDGNVYVLPLDTKVERKLTDLPPTNQVAFSARSPDGAHLAYVRVEPSGSTLWLTQADGGGERMLVDESTSYVMLERPQWTPDGSVIVYTYHGFKVENGAITGETVRAEAVDPDTGQRVPLMAYAEGPTVVQSVGMAFVRTARSGQQLVLFDPSGTEKVLVAERTFLSLAAPRFSPDGQRIAFVAVGDGPNRVGQRSMGGLLSASPAGIVGGLAALVWPGVAYAHGEPWDVWLAEVSGAIRRVKKLAEDEPTLAWSQDGQYLAASGGSGVYVINVVSGQVNQLTRVGGFGGIDWTP